MCAVSGPGPLNISHVLPLTFTSSTNQDVDTQGDFGSHMSRRPELSSVGLLVLGEIMYQRCAIFPKLIWLWHTYLWFVLQNKRAFNALHVLTLQLFPPYILLLICESCTPNKLSQNLLDFWQAGNSRRTEDHRQGGLWPWQLFPLSHHYHH